MARVLILFLFLVSACAPMAEIDLRVMEPAKITIPSGIHQIAFMNRSVLPHYLDSDSMQWTDEELYILDTLVNRWIFKGIFNSLSSSPLFSVDTIRIIRIKRTDTTGIREPLSLKHLKNVRENYQADALLSLEFYKMLDSLSVFSKIEDYTWVYEAYMGLYTTTDWRIYDLIHDTIIDDYSGQDTTEWYGYSDNPESAIESLPNAVDAIRAAALQAGTQYGNRISPQWQNVQRFYHISGGKEMKEAAKITAADDWMGAAEIWRKLAYGDKKHTAAKACFNMALACEMEDLMVPAIDWANKSYTIRQKTLTKDYVDLLNQRHEKENRLKIQLPPVDDQEN